MVKKKSKSLKSYMDAINETFDDIEKENRMREEIKARLLAQKEANEKRKA